MVAIRVGVSVELREAYEKLGVEPGTEPKKARRAYLKLLKVHKPETDPEGFKAIREAWERIKDAPDWEVRSMTEAPREAPALESAPAVSWSKPKRSWSEQAALSREGKLFDQEPPKPAPVPTPAPIDPDAPVTMATFYARGSGASDAQRVAIAREAVAKLPDEAEAHWLLHEALLVTSQMAEAAAVLRAAHEQGLDGFFEPLVRQHPEHLTPMEIEAAVQRSGDSLDALMVAEAMLRCEQAQAAADAMRRGLEAARRGGEPPSVRRVIDLVLRLYRQEHAGIARQLYDRVSEWLRESGAESEIAGTQVAASYALLRELAALPVDFPFEVKAAIARGILDGDVAFAIGDVAQWVLDHPKHLDDVASKLAIFAPTLHRSLSPAFAPQQPSNQAFSPAPLKIKSWGEPAQRTIPHPKPTGEPGYGKWIALAVVLFLFVALQVAFRSHRNRARYEAAPTFDYAETQELLRRLEAQNPTLDPTFGLAPTDAQIRLSGTQVCMYDPSSEQCRYARSLSQALRDRDCVGAADHKLGFDMAVEQGPALPDRSVSARAATVFQRALDDRCSPPTP